MSVRLDLDVIAESSGLVPPYDLEHALHEVCHATLLGLSVPLVDRFGEVVALTVGRMTIHAQDWHEIKTCATELRVHALTGMTIDSMTPSGVLGGNTVAMDPAVAEAHIAAMMWSEATYQRATRAISVIHETACWLRGPP